MELRSSRSRSRTPFISASTERDISEDQVGHTIIRTTRSTTKTTSANFNNVGYSQLKSTPEKSMKTRSSKSENVLRRGHYKTSDYSSEDGEVQVSPVSENSNNHFIEDSRRSASRSSGSVSAIDYYRAAGDYWNKYPKTDYTYSLYSRDRTEIAPGVVAMPNMSRRSLHGGDSSNEFRTSHKETNTESFDDESHYTPSYSKTADILRAKQRQLFTNNNYDSKYKYTSSKDKYVRTQSFRSRVSTFFVTIFTWISSAFYNIYSAQNSAFIWFGKTVHKVATRAMLWDTWLLRSLRKKNKVTSLLAVCLIPLIVFGGWWLLSQIGPLLIGKYRNNARVDESVRIPLEHTGDFNQEQTKRENIYLQPPQPGEIAAQLSSAQLQEIASAIKLNLNLEDHYNSDVIIRKIIASPNMQNIFNNYKFTHLQSGDESTQILLKNQQELIDTLKIEIDKIRLELLQLENLHNKDIAKIITQLRSEHDQNMAHLTNKINRCCRNSIIEVENHVTRILKEFFEAPHNLHTYKDIKQWLRSTFIAKEDLEASLANITQHLQSNFDILIKNNGEVIMDNIMSKISAELNRRIEKAQILSYDQGTVNIDSITDYHIKKIVHDSLAIYDADKTGLVDYALESAGGQILTIRCTESYEARTAVISVLGIPISYPTNNPRTAITPGVTPGECWAFQNFPAFLVIKLTTRVKIEAFSMEHMNKLLSSNGKIDSAPNEFYVYGLRNETDTDPVLLGRYFYDQNGPPLQYFVVAEHGLTFHIVELKIVSNHGNPNYTCLYRFRVHGKALG